MLLHELIIYTANCSQCEAAYK